MKAIILAAGRGSRLEALSEKFPKCFNVIGGKKLIEWQISSLTSAGIKEIIIVTGYKNEEIERLGLKTVHNKNWQSSNMVTSLYCAKEQITDDVIISYSDIIYGPITIKNLMKESNDIVVAYDPKWEKLWNIRFNNMLDDAESFKIDKSNKITEIGNKVLNKKDVEGQYMGLIKLTKLGFKMIKNFIHTQGELINKMDMTTLLSMYIKFGHPIYGMAINEEWCEVDTARDFIIANELYKKGKFNYNK